MSLMFLFRLYATIGMSAVPSRRGARRGNYPGALVKKGPAKNSVYEDILNIIIIIKNVPQGPSKTLVND